MRDFSDDSNLRIDDKSYGGGPGMVMRYKPVEDALKSIKRKSYVIYLSPQGSKLNQYKISELTKEEVAAIPEDVKTAYQLFEIKTFSF